MPNRRQEFVDRIVGERERNFMLPGSEHDVVKTVNDWLVTAISYIAQARQRGFALTSQEDFEDELVKGAAVILAALEHSDLMSQTSLLNHETDK